MIYEGPAMDTERALISKLISTGRMDLAITKGIELTHFADEECRDMFDYIVVHYRRYNAPPRSRPSRTIGPSGSSSIPRTRWTI